MVSVKRILPLIATAGLLLSGPAEAGQWTTSWEPTTTIAERSPSGGGTAVVSIAGSGLALGQIVLTADPNVQGSGSARTAISGTWIARWVPDNPDDWPAQTTLSSVDQRSFVVQLIDSQGTATVAITGGDTVVAASFPSEAGSTSSSPAPVTVVDSTDPNLVVTMTTSETSSQSSTATASTATSIQITRIVREYQPAWFTQRFAAPGDISVQIPVQSLDTTATLSATRANANSAAAASSTQSAVIRIQ